MYMEQTRELMEQQHRHVTGAIDRMAEGITHLSRAVEASTLSQARYEERQAASDKQMEHLNVELTKVCEVISRGEIRIGKLELDVQRNSDLRKLLLWLGAIIVSTTLTVGVALYTKQANPHQRELAVNSKVVTK